MMSSSTVHTAPVVSNATVAPVVVSSAPLPLTAAPLTTAPMGASSAGYVNTTALPATTISSSTSSHLPGSHLSHTTTKQQETQHKALVKEEKQHEKEIIKEQKELTKEEKKREKLMLKEQKKREKEEKKAMKKREKEERKANKLRQKEEEKRIEAQREMHMVAQKARADKYRAEEKATTARLQSNVKEFDLAHAHTAPLGLYSEQVEDALPYVPENVGLFIAVARALNLIDLKEAKADAYLRISVLGKAPDGNEVVHACHKSEVISNTSNPEWWFHVDDTPHLVTPNVGWLRTGKLRIEVWDHDKTSEDELLGSIEWPLSALDGKVTRGNFALGTSNLPLATGRTTRKSTKPGTIFAEIRYRSPFAFLGMHNKQPTASMQGMHSGMHSSAPLTAGAPLLASGAHTAPAPGMHHTGVLHSGAGLHTGALPHGHHDAHHQHQHHHHHHQQQQQQQPMVGASSGLHGAPLAPSGAGVSSSGGLSTVYHAPDAVVKAGSIAPAAISHTHHITATEMPGTVLSHGVTVTGASPMPLLGGEHKVDYRNDLLVAKPGMAPTTQQPLPASAPLHAHHHTVTPLMSTSDAAIKTGMVSTPAEPHNIMHNKTAGLPVTPMQPMVLQHGHGASPLPGSHPTSTVMVDAAPLGATAKPLPAGGLAITQPIGLQQPVGAINMADPPRHVF